MIFVSGLSKSGKTQTIRAVISASDLFEHVKASELLDTAGQPTRKLAIEQILGNQVALIDLLANMNRDTRKIQILDGHALIESTGGPVLLPDWVFDRLMLQAIVQIQAEPSLISSRRAGTAMEQGQSNLENLQRLETQHCQYQADRLRIPFMPISHGETLLETLMEIVRSG